MKSVVITFSLVLISLQIYAQRTIERKITLDGKSNITIKLPYATTIEVNTTDTSNELHLKAIIVIDSGRQDHKLNIKTKTRYNTLYVESDYGGLFEKEKSVFDFLLDKDESTIVNIGTAKNNQPVSINGISIQEAYVLYIPKNVELTLKSTSGNVTIASYLGNITTEIISGNIIVKDYNGDLTLKTVSGNIDMEIGDAATLIAETTIGKISKDGHVPNLIIGEKIIGSFAKRDFIGGKHTISLNSISGNIHLKNKITSVDQ